MNSKIQIVKKPDWVSWDEIHLVLFKAHASNREHGINMRKPSLPGDQIASEIGNDGIMFVALDDQNVVGTLAIIKMTGKKWYCSGEYGYLCFGAVLPEYGGKGVYRSLYHDVEETAKQLGLSVLTRDTNEKNARMLKITKKEGYHFVDYKGCRDHYNIVRAKWLVSCPFPTWYIRVRFLLSKLYMKARFKIDPNKGKVKRFGI